MIPTSRTPRSHPSHPSDKSLGLPLGALLLVLLALGVAGSLAPAAAAAPPSQVTVTLVRWPYT